MAYSNLSIVVEILLQCDETRPHCRTCTSSQYWCNYDFHTPDLEPLLQGSNHGKVQNLKHKKPYQRSSPVAVLAPALDTAFVVADANASIELDKASMKRLDHFRASTVYTFAHPKMAEVYQNGILRLGFSVRELRPRRDAAKVVSTDHPM